MGQFKALVVGINYPDSNYELRGCVNDANNVHALLTEFYGFEVESLLDEEATTAAILNGMENLVAGARPGDVLYFHYSGHGSQMTDGPDQDNEEDGLDEIICPVDLDWRDKVIRDDDMKRIFDKVPNGVNLTVVLDCCNSGGGLDHDNQYQPLVEEGDRDMGGEGRFLPPPPGVIAEAAPTTFKKRALSRDVNKTCLLISGCQSTQTSADARIDGVWQGACTYYLTEILREDPGISYGILVDELNARIAAAGYTQRPELNGPESLFSMEFAVPYATPTPPVYNPTPNLEPIPVILQSPPKEEKKGLWASIVAWFKGLFG